MVLIWRVTRIEQWYTGCGTESFFLMMAAVTASGPS